MTKLFPFTAVLAVFAAGCTAESLVSAPRVPIPVLLGPVDRVGGHRGEGEAVLSIGVDVDDLVGFATSRNRDGNTVYVTQTAFVRHDSDGALSYRILDATDAKHDKDVRVRKVGTGAWVWMTPDMGSMMRHEWIELDATVSKEQGR